MDSRESRTLHDALSHSKMFRAVSFSFVFISLELVLAYTVGDALKELHKLIAVTVWPQLDSFGSQHGNLLPGI